MTGKLVKKKLREACLRGEWLDLAEGESEGRVIDAEVLKDALIAAQPIPLHPIRIRNAVIKGALDLHCRTLTSPLRLERCEFDTVVDLTETRGLSIHMQACRVPALKAVQLELKGDLSLAESVVEAGVSLVDAHIGGQLTFDGATLRNAGGPALDADGAKVEKGISLRAVSGNRFEAKGSVRFARARVGGDLVIRGAELEGNQGPALAAGSIRVEGSLRCVDTDVRGEINLVSGYVRGQLTVKGATLENPKGRALNCDGIDVGQDLFLESQGERPFVAKGMVSLAGAHVGGQVSFERASFSNAGGFAVSANGLVVDQDMFFGASEASTLEIKGGVSIASAHVGGQLAFRGVAVTAFENVAVTADAIHVTGSLFLRGYEDHPTTVQGEFRLIGAQVSGALNVERCDFSNDGADAFFAARTQIGGDALWRQTTVLGKVSLAGASVGGRLGFKHVSLKGDGRVALNADGIAVDQGIVLSGQWEQGMEVEGELRLVGARVRGGLRMLSVSLDGPGRTLVADRLHIDGNLELVEMTASATVRLATAHVAGQVTFIGANLSSAGSPALEADGIVVEQDVEFAVGSAPFEAIGEIRFVNARIEGMFVLKGGVLRTAGENPAPVLNLEGAQVARSVLLTSRQPALLDLEGEVRMTGMQVRGDVTVEGSVSGGMRLERAEVKGQFRCKVDLSGGAFAIDFSDSAMGALAMQFSDGEPILDLRRGTVGVLHQLLVDGADWPKAHLDGLAYRDLSPSDLTMQDVDARLRWIAADPDGYSSQPYEQLREIYRRTGFEGGARRVGIFSQKQRRRHSGAIEKAGSRILGATVAHGYRPSQALFWMLALLAVGWVLFGCVFSTGTAGSGADLTALKPAEEQVSLEPVAYTADLLLPGIGLGQQGAWDAHGAAQWVGLALTCLGWLLAAAVLAGISVRRQ